MEPGLEWELVMEVEMKPGLLLVELALESVKNSEPEVL